MRRVPPALLALTAGFFWVACDFQEATGPVDESVPTEISKDQKIKIKDGLILGPPVQVVVGTGLLGSKRIMLWTLGSSVAATDITPPPPFIQAWPGDWSPDGTQLAFVGGVPAPTPGYDLGPGIYVMTVRPDGNPDFTTVKRVSDTPFMDFSPAWSPDGAKLAWQCYQPPYPPPLPPLPFPNGWNTGICYAERASTGVWGPTHWLTRDPAPGLGFFIDGPPSWSPGSDLILFSRIARGCSQDGGQTGGPPCPFTSFDLWTVEIATQADGTHKEINRTNTPGVDEEDPAWEPKPNSPKILFTTYGDGEEIDIFLGSLGPGGLTVISRVTSMSGAETFPWWVPGGRQITYTYGIHDREVFLVNLDGSDNTNLVNNPGDDDFARVRPPVITP